MLCPFCQTEYSAEELARCPNCGMREEYARNKPEAIPAEKPERGKIRRSPLGYFWSALSKYASTRGRARRTEYFWFMLFAFTCWVGLSYGVRAILASFEFGEEIVRYLANLSFLAWNLPEIALLPDNTTMSLSMSEAELFAAENSLLRLALFPGAVLGAILFVPPILSLFARRLHDVGLSGWHVVVLFSIQSIFKSLELDLFASFVPLFLLFWPGTGGTNAYGPDPRYATEPDRKDS